MFSSYLNVDSSNNKAIFNFWNIVILTGNGVALRLTSDQPIPKNVLVKLSVNHNKFCMFCESNKISEKYYGELYQLNYIITHSFCLVSGFLELLIFHLG